MNPTLTFATAARVLRQLSHDRRSVAMIIVLPSVLLGLFAWVFADTAVFERVGPPLLALFPFVLMFVITSITTLRERRTGTLERLLALPLGKGDFIVGYAAAFGVMAVVQAVVTVAFGVYVCGLEIDGQLWQLCLIAAVNGLLATSLGLLASAFAQTEFQAVQFLPVIVFPQIILGGILLPREDMPDVLRVISDWLPFSYAVEATNAVAVGDDGWSLWLPILIVVGFGAALLLAASLTLRRKVF